MRGVFLVLVVGLAAASDWAPVERMTPLAWNLESVPVQIRTDSTVGSGDMIILSTYTEAGRRIGSIIVKFSSPMQYSILGCTNMFGLTDFDVQPPAEDDKIWTIAKTDKSLAISCNGVGLLDYVFSSSHNKSCVENWIGNVVGEISFYLRDKASDYYRAISTPFLNCENFYCEMQAVASDWVPVVSTLPIVWDLESVPVQIRTDSTVGTDEDTPDIHLTTYTEAGRRIGTIMVKFSSPMQYSIGACNNFRWTFFDVQPPAEDEMIWTIAKSEKSLTISCNGVELLDYVFSRSSNSTCGREWSGDMVGKIMFFSRASDYYSAGTNATLLYCENFYCEKQAIASDWAPVERMTPLAWDLESVPLQIRTDSTVGSDEWIHLYTYAEAGRLIGTIYVKFSSPMQYIITRCNHFWTVFDVQPPAEDDKTWTITKTEESLAIFCNGVKLLEYTFSESSDVWGRCVEYWSGNVVGKISFYYDDSASDYYRTQEIN